MAESSNPTPNTANDATHVHHPKKLNVTVRELSHDECLAILMKHHVAHVGIVFHDLLRLKICNYLYSDGWIYARTELGQDLVMARHHPWAAFEVAEIDGIYDWRSVEVRGVIEFLSSSTQSNEWFEFENAVRLLRTAVPEVLTADDPTPQRIQLLRVHLDEVMGRESSLGTLRPLPLP